MFTGSFVFQCWRPWKLIKNPCVLTWCVVLRENYVELGNGVQWGGLIFLPPLPSPPIHLTWGRKARMTPRLLWRLADLPKMRWKMFKVVQFNYGRIYWERERKKTKKNQEEANLLEILLRCFPPSLKCKVTPRRKERAGLWLFPLTSDRLVNTFWKHIFSFGWQQIHMYDTWCIFVTPKTWVPSVIGKYL